MVLVALRFRLPNDKAAELIRLLKCNVTTESHAVKIGYMVKAFLVRGDTSNDGMVQEYDRNAYSDYNRDVTKVESESRQSEGREEDTTNDFSDGTTEDSR